MVIKTCARQRITLILSTALFSLILASIVFPQTFTLMGKDYKFHEEKWFTFFDGRLGAEVETSRLIVRLGDRGDVTRFPFDAFDIRGVTIASRRFLEGFYILSVETGMDPFPIARNLENTDLFDRVEFDVYMTRTAAPNDTKYVDQWNLMSDKLDVERAWNLSVGSDQVVVAIIDEGTQRDHEDLAGSIWLNVSEDANGNGVADFIPVSQGGDIDSIDNDGNGFVDDLVGWDFKDDDNNPEVTFHGTAVAGIVAARTNNTVGVAGIAGGWGSRSGVKLMILENAQSNGGILAGDMADAIDYAANNGASVINISAVVAEGETVLEDAVNAATSSKDVVVVCSAGNFNDG